MGALTESEMAWCRLGGRPEELRAIVDGTREEAAAAVLRAIERRTSASRRAKRSRS